MTAMTWPIDMAEELQEPDEELDEGTDYIQLVFSHLNYKAALLTPGIMRDLFRIVLLPISARKADEQIVNLIRLVKALSETHTRLASDHCCQ
ncbi:uncharacterized protein BJ212DRAFT_1311482 [Suillus subaureus]|uniref:Timeless N-terminal domain-containing protein n=1 Tax=Suillus subaureus TaxID=48587 RepID=A0A9P7EPV8_9AGAM|nr:uncharacterized protein BJ212DRAFT_1311482 [Suillus subaureus]KAG1827312.1 hypothetical protein BJ212DRAFT_1311482 [Suillus subaureus]